MKILLAVPPGTYSKWEYCFITFPLGIAYLAAELVKKNNVEILDCMIEDPKPKSVSKEKYLIGLSWEKIKERLKDINPDIVGISCAYTSQYYNAVKFAELVKKYDKDAITVLGGAHPSALPEDSLKNPYIDFVVIGEGEDSFVKLVDALKERKDVSSIAGIGCKKNGKVIINKKIRYKKNIDELPFPARHLFPMEKYFYYGKEHAFYSKNHPSTTLITSRGCPGRCVYCSIHSVFGSVWRSRSPKNIEEELEYLVKTYNIQEIHFEDDNLTLNKDRMMLICDKMIRNNLRLIWTTPNGVSINHLDEELIKKMKEAGCYKLFLGIESGSQHVLDNIIKKGLSLDKAKRIIKLLKENHIKICGFFVIGLPEETKTDIESTISFAKAYDFDTISFSIATPYPGTELYEDYKKNGLLENYDAFMFNPNHATIPTDELSSEKIMRLRNKAHFRFHLNKMLKHPLKYFTQSQNYAALLRYLNFFIKTSFHRNQDYEKS